jgi:hypothetical protein
MNVPESIIERATRCQARPRAARPGYREDMLCASLANTSVCFHDVDVPVCRMHEATYRRWADAAEGNATALWGWTAQSARNLSGDHGPRLAPVEP